MNNKKMSISVIVSFVVMVFVNVLANILPLNGFNTGQISDKYMTLIAPAGYTFSIWLLIYIMLALYCQYQYSFYIRYRHSTDRVMKRVNQYFLLSNLANIAWIILWHYENMLGSMIAIFVLLILLIRIRQTIARRSTLSFREKKYLRLPFSIYFGWITVASIANVSSYLVSIQWNSGNLSKEVLSIAVLIVGFLIGYLTMMYFMDSSYGLVILWAYFGIFVRHITVFNKTYSLIIFAAISLSLLMAVGVTQIYLMNKKKSRRR